jgi:glycerol kinase
MPVVKQTAAAIPVAGDAGDQQGALLGQTFLMQFQAYLLQVPVAWPGWQRASGTARTNWPPDGRRSIFLNPTGTPER